MGFKMFKKNASCLAALAFALGAASAGASDLNPLGFYFGGAVGQSNVRANEVAGFGAPQGASGVPLGFDEHHTGWKLDVGMRPILPLGVELAYVDFGHPAALGNFYGNSTGLRTQIDAHPKAFELSGLAYLPLPVPLVDVYAKAKSLHRDLCALDFGRLMGVRLTNLLIERCT
jgi:hypothetical protein